MCPLFRIETHSSLILVNRCFIFFKHFYIPCNLFSYLEPLFLLVHLWPQSSFYQIWSLMFLLLLSCFSHVRLCATPQTAAHQAPLSLGFSRQGTGVGSQCIKVKSQSEVTQSCPTHRDLIDCSPPGSSIHGIFQARVLEWGAIYVPICQITYTNLSNE